MSQFMKDLKDLMDKRAWNRPDGTPAPTKEPQPEASPPIPADARRVPPKRKPVLSKTQVTSKQPSKYFQPLKQEPVTKARPRGKPAQKEIRWFAYCQSCGRDVGMGEQADAFYAARTHRLVEKGHAGDIRMRFTVGGITVREEENDGEMAPDA